MRYFTALATSLCLATTAMAEDRPNTILVMDGSGSMWGQIDGVAKITIAQQVVEDLLQTIPEDQGLGLTVYGHRERGNCTDIETVVAPAPGTRDAIIALALLPLSIRGFGPVKEANAAKAATRRSELLAVIRSGGAEMAQAAE